MLKSVFFRSNNMSLNYNPPAVTGPGLIHRYSTSELVEQSVNKPYEQWREDQIKLRRQKEKRSVQHAADTTVNFLVIFFLVSGAVLGIYMAPKIYKGLKLLRILSVGRTN